MSFVTVYTIDRANRFAKVGEAKNASAFHIAIWRHLGIKHQGWSDDWSWFGNRSRGRHEELWAEIGTMPRADGLAMAATFDRCWFPWSIRADTISALRSHATHAATAGALASLLTGIAGKHRGLAFASSLADAWVCYGEGGRWHHHVRFAKNERMCRACGVSDIGNAADLVAP